MFPESEPTSSRRLPISGTDGALLALAGAELLVQSLLPRAQLAQGRGHLFTLSVFLAALACFRRAALNPERRRSWLGFGLASAIHVLSSAFTQGVDAYPALPYFVVAGYLIAMVEGLTQAFDQGIRWAGGIRRVLDGTVFALAVMTLAWEAVLGAFIVHHPAGWIRLLLSFGTFSVLLGIVVFEAQVDLRRLKGPLGWLGLYLLSACTVDVLSIRAHLAAGYDATLGIAYLDPLLPLLLTRMALTPWTRDALSREEGRGQSPWGGVIAYFPFGLSLLWLVGSLRPGQPPQTVPVVLVVVMASLMLIRQLIALRDQASFHRILQERLEARTLALEEAREAHLRAHRMNLVATVGAGMAHDLNNLLGVVCTLVEQRGDPAELLATAHRAAALARRTMAHAGAPEADRELFDLGERLRDLEPVLRRLAGGGVVLEIHHDGGEHWMEMNPLQAEQVLVNLVTNARDAMAGAGELQITLRGEEGWTELEVRDTGPGMAPEVRERIFEPFFTTKGKGRGTGLGLTSLKALVEEVGGGVEVASVPGEGSTFRVRFPRITDL